MKPCSIADRSAVPWLVHRSLTIQMGGALLAWWLAKRYPFSGESCRRTTDSDGERSFLAVSYQLPEKVALNTHKQHYHESGDTGLPACADGGSLISGTYTSTASNQAMPLFLRGVIQLF